MTSFSHTPLPKDAPSDELSLLSAALRSARQKHNEHTALKNDVERAKRRARAALERYEELVARYNGQLAMFEDDDA